MRSKIFRNILVLTIVLLFIGSSVAPVMGNIRNKDNMFVSSSLLKNDDDVTVTVSNIGNEIELIYNIWEYDIEQVIIDGEEYVRIVLEGESNIMEKGSPDLPNICRSVIIPDDAKMKARIIDADYQEFENILIAPSKGILPRTINPSDVPYVLGDVYNRDESFPGEIAELEGPYILRDFRGQVVKVNPFQYNPMSKILRVYNEITIEISPIGPGEINVYHRSESLTSMDTDFKSIYEHHFLNFNIGLDKDRYTPVEEQGNMLIICYDSFYSTMIPFVTWKNTKGIPTEIVNLSDVGITANDIDNYIETYYNSNGLTFVLLVGDIQQIPSLYYSGHASDPSFSYIVGSDNYQDLFIGRFSAQTVAQLETQIDRSIEYEKYPQTGAEWYYKGMGVASNEGTGDDGEYDWEHMRNIRNDLLSFTYTEVDEFYDGSHGGEDAGGNPSSSMVQAAVDDGRSIINYCGHGGPTSWSTSGFSNSNINNLINDNMLPFVICVACNNGEFEHYDTCFAEAWMRATNSGEPTGAIGVFASTQSQSWDPPMDAQDEIVDLLVNGEKNTIGGLSFSGTMHMMDEYGSSCYDETNTWTVFGDPSIQIFTDAPFSMSVQHNPTIMSGALSFDVTVTGVEDALCAISYNGELLGYEYTDVNGEATINFNGSIDDMDVVDLVVTAFNKMPYIITLDVTPPVRQPAEFEPMGGVLINYGGTDSFGISYDVIAEMSEDVEVVTIVDSLSQQTAVQSLYLSNGVDLNNCSFLIAPSDKYWTRDYGPWFIFNDTAGVMEVVDFEYNRPRPNDNAIPAAYANDQSLTLNYMDIIHTGGNYMTDGKGIAVSTELVYTENPSLSSDDIDQIVADSLGIRTYHLYPDPLGEYIEHVDCWGKYLSPDTIMIIEVSPSHSNYAEIEAAAAHFENQMSCYGAPYQVERIYTHLEEPYINSLILNDKVFVPVTGSSYDAAALAAYEAAMPGYEILGFTGSWQNTDALHCRAKGIPDRGMIYVDHEPFNDQMPSDDGFMVEADITLFSGGNLVGGSPLLHWKNGTAGIWNTVVMNLDRGDSYNAYIPSHPCGEIIYYYINAEDTTGRIENYPYIGVADPCTFNVTLVPDIWVDPLSFDLNNSGGVTITDVLTVGNHEFAGEELSFDIACDDSGLGWLSVNVTNGNLMPATYMNVTVTADTNGIDIGSYYGSIVITSDDPDEPLIIIPVNLTVVLANDIGAISINYPTDNQSPGSYVVNATIENFGSMDQTGVIVNCTIYEGGIGGTIFEEDFATEPTDWTITHTAGTAWTWDNTDQRMEHTYGYPNSGYLDSPVIDCTGITGTSLSFWHYWKADYSSGNQDGYVRGSIDGGNTYPYLIDEFHHLDPAVETAVKYYTLSWADNQPSVKIRFDIYNNNDYYWYIDDINISTDFVGDICYSSETTVGIDAYEQEFVEFTPAWNAQDLGIYAIKVTTLLPVDQDTSNDVAMSSVEIFQDVVPPDITNINDYPDPQAIDGWVNITCSVTDFIEVSSAYVNISGPAGFIPINASMIETGVDSYYYYDNYSVVGTYDYFIWANDTSDNSNISAVYHFEIIEGSIIYVDIPLTAGWNHITIPVENNWMASSLGENITGCTQISYWNNTLGAYQDWLVDYPDPENDYPIEDGRSYFVYVNTDSVLQVSGPPVFSISVPLGIGWNMIGWYKENSAMASSLGENITGCTQISYWNNTLGAYQDWLVDFPDPEDDYSIHQGMGFFVYTDESSVWHGEG